MAITNRITVSSFETKIKSFLFTLYCCFFPIKLYHTVITKKKKKEKSTATLASCKKPHTLARRIGKEIKA